MSLRKSRQLTPPLLAPTRNNAQHSTGARSPAAKQNSKLNPVTPAGEDDGAGMEKIAEVREG